MPGTVCPNNKLRIPSRTFRRAILINGSICFLCALFLISIGKEKKAKI